MLTFPRRTNPAIVDWVDYAKTVNTASPSAFADDLAQKAAGDHTVWLVWQPGYQTYGIKCETIAADLSTLATKSGGGAPQLRRQPAGALLRAHEPDRVRLRRLVTS